MDFLRVFRVARKHWVITIIGVLLGVVCAFAVSYRLAMVGGQLHAERRSRTTYKSEVQILISEPGYGMGSAGVVEESLPEAFGKTQAMAPVYAQLVLSDAVMNAASLKLGSGVGELVEAEAVKDCPIVKVKLTGDDPARLTKLALALAASLEEYLTKNQDDYNVPPGDRLTVGVLSAPRDPIPQRSREIELALLAFASPILLAMGVGFVLERPARPTNESEEDGESCPETEDEGDES
jgi:capsular polysaccharide biosynthesis protein